jgi:hypothetical protein
MRECIRFTIEESTPASSGVLRSQGLPPRSELSERIGALLDSAILLFTGLAQPTGVLADLSKQEFEMIYRGDGLNPHETPLEEIFPEADSLALFAATLGGLVSERISHLLAADQLALGFMLDAVASEAADQLAIVMGRHLSQRLLRERQQPKKPSVLAYSPGYCGWHLSGQDKLFQFLHPEQIGITLNTSYLMEPLKSVSGVLVAGRGEIHRFRPEFSFCGTCKTHQCLDRMASV